MSAVRGSFRELGRDAGAYGLASVLGRSSVFLLLPVYTRVFAPAEFAVLEAAVMAGALLNLLMQAELNNALLRYYATETEEGRRDLVTTLFCAVAALGGALALAGSLAAGPAARLLLGSSGGRAAVLLVLWTAFTGALAGLASAQLRMERQVKRAVLVQLVAVFGAPPLILLFVLRFDWGVTGVLAGTFAGAVAAAAVGIGWTRAGLTGRFRADLLRRSMAFSLPLVPTVAARYARRFSDRLLLLGLLGPAAMGVYALGSKLAGIPEVLIQAFRTGWIPASMRLIGQSHQHAVYEAALRYYTLLLGSLGFAVAAASPELLHLLGTPAYAGAQPVIGWLVGAAVVMGAGSYVVVGAMVAERSSVSLAGTWAGAAAAVAGMLALIPVMGIEGAAIGAFLGSVVATGTTYRLSQRVYPIPFAIGRVSAALGLYVLLLATVLRWSGALPWAASAGVRAAAALFFAAVCGMLLLPPAERGAARRELERLVRRGRGASRPGPLERAPSLPTPAALRATEEGLG